MRTIKYYVINSSFYRYYILWSQTKKRYAYLKKHYPSLSYEELQRLVNKTRVAWIKFLMGYSDFYMLHCEDKSMNEIGEFVPYRESSAFCGLVSSASSKKLLNDKYACYKHFSKFYGRRVLMVSSEEIANGNGLVKLSDFIGNSDDEYIIKPVSLNCGRGIKKMADKNRIYDYLKQIRGGIVEEIIVQDESLAAFNQSSVNTLRIQTANYGNGEIDVLWPCLRMGRAGSIVDNAGAGGIFSAIDVATGTTTAAIDESRKVWEFHPDSQKALIGFTIPRWEEAVALAKELARNIPKAGIVAWDLALTKKGWVMVEGNASPLIIYQIAVRHGIRAEFNKMKAKFKTAKAIM